MASASATRRRQAREETRSQILAAADSYLRERPFRELTVEELMARTGLARTVFYRHFADLHEMIVRLLEEVGDELMQFSREWAGSVDDMDGAGREHFRHIVDFFADNGPLIRAIADAATSDEELERIYRGFIDLFVDLTAEALERLIADHRIAPLDARQTARALTLLNESYLLDAFGREPAADPETVTQTLWTIWRRVVFTTPQAPPR